MKRFMKLVYTIQTVPFLGEINGKKIPNVPLITIFIPQDWFRTVLIFIHSLHLNDTDPFKVIWDINK